MVNVTAYPKHPQVWHHGDNITLQCNSETINSVYELIFVWKMIYKTYSNNSSRKTRLFEYAGNKEHLLTSVDEFTNGADYTCEVLIETPVRNETTNASDRFDVTIYCK